MLRYADATDLTVSLHTDGLHEPAWRRSSAAEGVPSLPKDPGLADPDDRDDTARVLR